MSAIWAVHEHSATDPVELLVETTRQVALADLAARRGLTVLEGVEYPDRESEGSGHDIAVEGTAEQVADVLAWLSHLGLTGFDVQVTDEHEVAAVWAAFDTITIGLGFRHLMVWFVGPDNQRLGEGFGHG